MFPSLLKPQWFLLCVATCVFQAGCSSKTEDPTSGKSASGANAADADVPAVINPKDVEEEKVGTLSIFTTPPGCIVFVDSVAVRGEGDTLSLSPCQVSLPVGTHAISVEKPGGIRKTERVEVTDRSELEFDVSSTPGSLDEPSILNAALFEAAVGRSIRLDTLSSSEHEFDPFLSADGLTIYFASDRGGVKGIYVATRNTPYEMFGEPSLVPASVGADQPLSPSVSDDSLILVYAVAQKARLWQSTRREVAKPFDSKEITRGDDQSERTWWSAQLSGDGLRLYWTEEGADGTLTRAAVRSATGKLFGKTLAFELPGKQPHMSADSMRQFSFDGKQLKRARRGTTRQAFGEPEVIAELELENYSESPHHRQFWVSEDEQWMYYSSSSESNGDLFIVRLSDGPGWGRQFAGKSIADKVVAVRTVEEKPKPEMKPVETVDPRTLPIPYTTHWTEFTKLLASRQGDAAIQLVSQAKKKRELSDSKTLLDWDLQLAEAVRDFDHDLNASLAALKPGAAVRVGGTRFEFDHADGDTLHLKLKDKEITRKLSDLTPGECVSLADSGPEKADAAHALRYGIYLYFQGSAQHSIAEPWFKRAGKDGTEFFERLARRELHQAQAELARGDVAAGMRFLDAVNKVGPNTTAASDAAKERAGLYDKVRWETVGPRKWKRGEFGEYSADTTRSNNSYLKSAEEYGDYELSCEWMVSGGPSMGGVFLRAAGQGKPLEKGGKIQLASDSDLNKLDPYFTGALFGDTAPSVNASLPEGKWNTLRIQVRGSNVQVWINDKEVLQTEIGKDVPSRGHVMLDGAAGGIAYRRLILFELPPKK